MGRATLSLILAAMMTFGAAASSPSPSPAKAADRAGPVILRGHNTLMGRRAGSISVIVPRRTSLNVHLMPGRRSGPNPQIGIRGRGRAVGFALSPAGASGGLDDGTITAARFTRCRARGCVPRGRTLQFMWPFGFGPGPHRALLPKGRYDLHLIADRAPATISFRLRGLEGRTKIEVTRPVEADIRSPKPRVDVRGDTTVFSAGSTYRTPGRGVIVSALWAYGRPFRGGPWGMCSYAVPARVPPEAGYGPGCSALGHTMQGGSASTGVVSGGDNIRGFSVSTISAYDSTAGARFTRRAIGAWIASRGRVRQHGAQAFVLRLGGEEKRRRIRDRP